MFTFTFYLHLLASKCNLTFYIHSQVYGQGRRMKMRAQLMSNEKAVISFVGPGFHFPQPSLTVAQKSIEL